MRNNHVEVDGSTITFNFQGKSGVEHTVDLARPPPRQDRPALPGPARATSSSSIVDDDGEPHAIDSADVNDYLREITGQDFTAKDFRTWAGTVLACELLYEFEAFELRNPGQANVVAGH